MKQVQMMAGHVLAQSPTNSPPNGGAPPLLGMESDGDGRCGEVEELVQAIGGQRGEEQEEGAEDQAARRRCGQETCSGSVHRPSAQRILVLGSDLNPSLDLRRWVAWRLRRLHLSAHHTSSLEAADVRHSRHGRRQLLPPHRPGDLVDSSLFTSQANSPAPPTSPAQERSPPSTSPRPVLAAVHEPIPQCR